LIIILRAGEKWLNWYLINKSGIVGLILRAQPAKLIPHPIFLKRYLNFFFSMPRAKVNILLLAQMTLIAMTNERRKALQQGRRSEKLM
jgi:hypothetical protein